MAPFIYPQLNPKRNEIRLLYPVFDRGSAGPLLAEPAPQEDGRIIKPDLSLDFELRVVSLNDAPSYTALSYV
jgi:hypothetical protein